MFEGVEYDEEESANKSEFSNCDKSEKVIYNICMHICIIYICIHSYWNVLDNFHYFVTYRYLW